jgi:hypothetical protein
MARTEVRTSVGAQGGPWRERIGVLVLAGGIVSLVAVYLVLNATMGGHDSSRTLFPYQVLAGTLPQPDQHLFHELREGLLRAEADRARTSSWPDVAVLASAGVAPFAPGPDDAAYAWSKFDQDTIVDYFGRPQDPSAPAWILEIQEPLPGLPPDPAPNDEEHHRLPDGTVLHIYVWAHRYGGQLEPGFVRQPESVGWTEVFSTPPNPVYYNRR